LDLGESSPFEDPELEGRILARLEAADTTGQLIELLKIRVAAAMAPEAAVISRPNRKKLFARVGKIVLERTIGELKHRS
jgi:hypothetical protein